MALRSLILVPIALMACTLKVSGQHDHSSHGHSSKVLPPPHGGSIKDAGKYMIEMTVDFMSLQDQLTFYLLKGNMKPVSNKDITGEITLQNESGPASTRSLLAQSDDRFVAQLTDLKPFRCKVTMLVRGKKISAVFTHEGLGHGHTGIYSCSMHPDIQSDTPGNCPICGMTLQKANQ